MVVRAQQARQIVARGEREARSPRNGRKKKYRPGRPTETGQSVCRPSGARALFISDPGAACLLRSHLPLATICRACGASEPWLPSTAPAALRNPGYHLPRLRRFGTPGYHLPRLRRFGTLRARPARTNNDVNFRDRTLAQFLIIGKVMSVTVYFTAQLLIGSSRLKLDFS
jgi:hypothetical protein